MDRTKKFRFMKEGNTIISIQPFGLRHKPSANQLFIAQKKAPALSVGAAL